MGNIVATAEAAGTVEVVEMAEAAKVTECAATVETEAKESRRGLR